MENVHTTTRSPTWWTPDQDRGWDRVKAAFRRDWEQTKSDLTAGRKGSDLNQDINDTMGQAFGKKRVPGEAVINPMNADELEAHVHRAAKEMNRSAERLAKAAEKSITKGEEDAERTDHAFGPWEDAEAALRYGHAARSHYGTAWDDATERQLEDEWAGLHPTDAWGDVRDTVRLGWGRGST